MGDTEHREQHNHGSGTFVGGDVHGGIWHIFLPPYSKKPSSAQPPPERRPEQDDDDETDDYEDLAAPLIASAAISAMTGLAVVYEVMGWPLSDGASPPGVVERIIGGLIFGYGCLAAVATFSARLAQVFELWSEQCAITATQTRGRLVARPPALMARVMAAASAVAAGVAELLASLYGWRSFGGEVSRRAHLARLNAAANAKTARAAAKRRPTA